MHTFLINDYLYIIVYVTILLIYVCKHKVSKWGYFSREPTKFPDGRE